MKKLFIPILSGLLFSCSNAPAQDIVFTEKIHKEFTASASNTLAIYNINGHIKVEGYDGNKVIIDVEKKVSAKNQAALDEGKAEFKLNFDQNTDSLIVYMSEPWDSRPNRNHDRWNNHRNIEYDYNLDFVVKVPKGIHLIVSTVNRGNIDVVDVVGKLKANNVNGKIMLKNAKDLYDVHTVNGNITINYIALPPDNAKYYTLNGNLNITYPADFSADCEFKSFHGDFYTDFENVEKLPAKITKISKEDDKGTTHKLSKGSTIRIGNGGKNLKFETFNGNIYIKKQS